jgi:hypothetical protein
VKTDDIPLGLERLRAARRQNVLRGIRQRLVPFHGGHDPDGATLLRLENRARTRTSALPMMRQQHIDQR